MRVVHSSTILENLPQANMRSSGQYALEDYNAIKVKGPQILEKFN